MHIGYIFLQSGLDYAYLPLGKGRVGELAFLELGAEHTVHEIGNRVAGKIREGPGGGFEGVADHHYGLLLGTRHLTLIIKGVGLVRVSSRVEILGQEVGGAAGAVMGDDELQLSNISNHELSEEVYYNIIKGKTAALFEACAAIGAQASGASDEEVAAAARFGQNLGI